MVAVLAQTGFPARKKQGGYRRPFAGVYKRCNHRVDGNRKLPSQIFDEDDHEDKPVYVPAPITLAAVSTTTITDTMVGLPENPAAQEAAESYVQMTIAWNRKQAERGTRMTGPETLTHPLKQAIDAGYERRHELLDLISELEPKSPARLAHIVMLSEVDKTIRQTKANFDLVARMEG